MISSKEELKEFLRCERKYYISGSVIKGLLKLMIGNEGAVIWNWQRRLRITEYHYNTHHKFRYGICKVLLNHMYNRYGLHIGLNVSGKGLHVMHLGPILINKNVRIGENCCIHTNTALVAGGMTNKTPVIGDNVVIGLGTTILGGVTIANGIAIGANSLVNKSFLEEDIGIAGNPARKISNNGRKQWERACASELKEELKKIH